MEIAVYLWHFIPLHAFFYAFFDEICPLVPGFQVIPFSGELLHHYIGFVFGPVATNAEQVVLSGDGKTQTEQEW